MTRKLFAGALALALVLGAGACSSDDESGGGDGGGDLADTLKQAAADEGEELTDEQADCAAEVMIAVLGEDEAQAAAAEGSAGIEEAMTSFGEVLAGSGDMEAAGEILDNLLSVSDSCLEELGVDKAELESLQELTG